MAQTKDAALEIEQSFNESELADIMSEIENLEKDFLADSSISNAESSEVQEEIEVNELTPDKVPVETPENQSVAEGHPTSDSESLLAREFGSKTVSVCSPEVLKVRKEEVRKTTLQSVIDQEVSASLQEVTDGPAMTTSQDAKMHFTVEGQMRINLSFQVGEQHVELMVSETEGLIICLDHGAKLSVPFTAIGVKGKKQAA